MNINDFLPQSTRMKGELLEGWGMDGDTFVISNVTGKTYERPGQDPERKICVHFAEADGYPLECNKTQLKTFAELFGAETDAWRGKKVILMSGMTSDPSGKPCKTVMVKAARSAAPNPNAPTSRPAARPVSQSVSVGGDAEITDPFE
jgi:hypothetical protein